METIIKQKKAYGEVNKPGFTKEEMKLDAVVVGVGMKYYF